MAQRHQFDPESDDHIFPGPTMVGHHVRKTDISRRALPITASFEDQRVSARLIGELQQRLTVVKKRCLESAKTAPDDGREAWFKSMLYEGDSLLQQARGALVRGTIAETHKLLTETQEAIHRIESSL
jgi:hypothetical protein